MIHTRMSPPYRFEPQGAGLPIPNLFLPFASSTLPPGRTGAVNLSSPAPGMGEVKGDSPSSPNGPTPSESRFDKKLLLAFVNDPKPAEDFSASGLPNVKGSGAGISTCLDLIGLGGGLAGDGGPSLSLSLSLSRSRWGGRGIPIRADWNPEVGIEVPGRAYSSWSDAQYSAARVALVISRRAKRLKFRSWGSGASHMLKGGAARTLSHVSVIPDNARGTYCLKMASLVATSSGNGRPSMPAMLALTF
jgi:hypothetical protein